ncbi:hypothetical protein [Nonomuraea longicatena]|uniref:WD40 repeat domain-containing protein n=1 Tax=Nonomuraea longicatena TaxID=83682 RepID=UPI0031D10C85
MSTPLDDVINGAPEVVGRRLEADTSAEGALLAAVYQASDRDTDAAARRQLLALDATRYGHPDLAARLAATAVPGAPEARWAVEWATGTRLSPRPSRSLPGVFARPLATVAIDGRPHLVGCGPEPTVHVWDLTTGEQVGKPLTGPDEEIACLAPVTVGDRPHLVAGDENGSLWLWDLITREQVGDRLTGPAGEARELATATIDGRPHAVSLGKESLRVWDLTTGEQRGEPLTGFTYWSPLTTTVIDGRPYAVVGESGDLHVCDLTTGTRADPLRTCHQVDSLASVTIDGRPCVVVGSLDEDGLSVWDLTTRELRGERMLDDPGAIESIAPLMIEGRPHAVTASEDRTIRLWDLTACRQVGRPMIGFPAGVDRVSAALVGGRPVAVDWTLRVWDLTEQVGTYLPGHPYVEVENLSRVVVDGRAHVLSEDEHGTTQLRDLATGTLVEGDHPAAEDTAPLDAPAELADEIENSRGAARLTVGGRPYIVTASGDTGGWATSEVLVWDAITARQVDRLVFPCDVNALIGTPEGQIVVAFGLDLAVLRPVGGYPEAAER